MVTRKLPFGFHTGIGGNAHGLGIYAETLNQAGIPFTVMAADGMPYEFQEIARQNPTIPNFVGFRRSVSVGGQTPPSGDVNVPDYSKSPQQAATEHTNWLLDRLPPELDKTITWITDINEPRHSEVDHPGITEWLAEYSIAAANICWSRGAKYVALNFAGGNHPLWENAGTRMRELYTLAANNSHRLMIGTHEYSWTPDDILAGDGYLVGRIRLQLLDHMPNVPVVVTEFGWSETTVPNTTQAMQDYLTVANTYYNHLGIKGVATWYLGGGFGNIANLVQPLISPLTQLTLETDIEVAPIDDCDCPTISDVRTTALWIPQYNLLTQDELQAVRAWARNGFPDNNGVITTGNHMLCPSHIDALRIHTQGLPDSILGIAFPEKIGTGVTLQWIQENCPCALEDGKQVVFLGQSSSRQPATEDNTNLLNNHSFENGWTNIIYGNLVNQQPISWELELTPVGQPIHYVNTLTGQTPDVTTIPEAIHKFDYQLPPDEQPGGSRPLILDGVVVYKMFAVNGIWSGKLRQVINSLTPNRLVRVVVPVQVHYHSPIGDDSPDDFELGIVVSGQEHRYITNPDLPDRQWRYLEVDGQVNQFGVLTVEIKACTKWQNSRDLFIDNLSVIYIDDVPTGDCSAISDVKTTALWIPQYGSMSSTELQQVYDWAQYGFPDNNNVMTSGNHMLCPSHIDALRIHTQGLPNSILGIAFPEKIGTGVTLQWIQENCPCALEDGKQVVFLGGSNTSFQFTSPPLITR